MEHYRDKAYARNYGFWNEEEQKRLNDATAGITDAGGDGCNSGNIIEKHIPVIESKVFIDHPDARFALGLVAVNNVITNGYSNEFFGAAQLRAKTYLEEGFIRSDDLDDAGTELDENDQRSAHFVILERMAVTSLARVVGNIRLIIKSTENPAPLPIENYFQDVFSENPIAIGGSEVSRLIARHEDPKIQSALKWPLFVAGYKYVEQHKLGPVYGLMSPALTKLLKSQHIPVSAVAEAHYISEINAKKQPTIINLPMLKRLVDIVGDQGVDVSTSNFSYLTIANSKELK